MLTGLLSSLALFLSSMSPLGSSAHSVVLGKERCNHISSSAGETAQHHVVGQPLTASLKLG